MATELFQSDEQQSLKLLTREITYIHTIDLNNLVVRLYMCMCMCVSNFLFLFLFLFTYTKLFTSASILSSDAKTKFSGRKCRK